MDLKGAKDTTKSKKNQEVIPSLKRKKPGTPDEK